MAGQNKPRPRWSRWLLRSLMGVGVLLLAVVLLLATALFALGRPSVQDWVVPFALEQTRDILPGLKIKRLRGPILGELVVEGLELRDRFGGDAISVERLELRYDVGALLRGLVRVDKLTVVGPRVHLAATKAGGVNLAELLVPTKEEPEPPSEPTTFRLEVKQLTLSRGSFTMDKNMGGPLKVSGLELDVGATLRLKGGGLTAAVKSLVLQAAGITLPDGQRLALSLTGAAGLAQEQVHARLKLGVDGMKPRRALNLRLTAAGTMNKPQVELEILLPQQGRARLKARAELSAAWDLTSYEAGLELDKINPAALWPGLPSALAGLKLKVTGAGLPLHKDATLKASLSSDGAKVLDYKLDRLRLQAGMKGERWTVKALEARGHGAKLHATGSGDLATLTASRVKLDLPSLAGLPLPDGVPALAGAVTLNASANGPFVGPLSAKAELSAKQLGVDKLTLGGLKLVADVKGLPQNPRGKLDLGLTDLDPGAPEARLKQATLGIRGNKEALTLDLTASGPRLWADLGTGLSLKGKRLDVTLRRLAVKLDGRRLELGDEAGARLDLNRRLDLGRTRFKLLGGTVELEGKVKLRGQPRLMASVKARGVRLLPGRPKVSADLQATVGREALVATVSLDAGARAEFTATVPVRHGKGAVPTLALGGDLGLTLEVPALPLSLVRRWVPGLPPLQGTASLSLTAAGSPKDPTGRLVLGLKGVGVSGLKGLAGELDVKLERAHTTVTADFKLQGKDLLKLDLWAGTGPGKLFAARKRLLGYLEAVPVTGRLELSPGSLSVVGDLAPDLKGRLSGQGSARLVLRGTVLQPGAALKLKSRGVKLDGDRLPDLDGDVSLLADEHRVRARVKLAAQGRPLLFAEGGLGVTLRRLVLGRQPAGAVPLAGRAELLDTDLARLVVGHARLGRLRGKLSATATAAGTLAAPGGKLALGLRGGGMGRALLGDLGLTATLAPAGPLKAEMVLLQKAGGQLRAHAALDVRRLEEIALDIKGKELDLGFLAGLTSAMRETGGKLALDLKVSGKLSSPSVLGTVALQRGRVLLTGMKPLADIGLGLTLHKEKLVISSLGWLSGGGNMTGHGEVALSNLRPGKFSLDLQAVNYDLGVDPVKGSKLTTAVKVRGALAGNRLKASVKLDQSKLKLAKIGGGKDLHQAGALPEVVFVDGPGRRAEKGKDKAGGAVPLGLEITADVDPLFVRGADLDVEALAHVQARTNAAGKVCLHGEARLRRGWIMVLDNKYKVKRAIVQFGGQPKPDPALDVQLYRELANVTVNIAVGGTASKPELILSSRPSVYTQSQILSMILTGNPQVIQEDDQDADPAGMVTAAVLSTVLGPLTREVANTVGLDVAKVSLENQKSKSEGGDEGVNLKAQAEVGKYITDRIYLGYRKVFGGDEEENSHEGILEYAISARWLLMAMFGDKGVGGLDIFWTYRY